MILLINLLLQISFANLVTVPKDCVATTAKCSIWNKAEVGYEYKTKGAVILLQKDAIFSAEIDSVELISGNFAVSATDTLTVKTSYATFLCVKCEVQMTLHKGYLEVRHAEGELSVKSIDKNEFEVFPVGFETKFYPVNALTGKSKQEIYSPLDLKSFLQFYDKFPQKDMHQKKWEARKDYFSEKSREAASIYKGAAEQQLADDLLRKQKREAAIKLEQDERAKFRKLYRQKNYLE
jgi:hypothetical protein